MKKKTIFLLLFALLTTTIWAQSEKPLTEAESQSVISALTQAAASMQTLQCGFVQEKTSSMLAEPSIAKGTMHYSAPDRMRWEYTEPYAFALVVNGEKITKVTDGTAEMLDGKSSRMYQGMVGLIMGSASGKKLFDTSDDPQTSRHEAHVQPAGVSFRQEDQRHQPRGVQGCQRRRHLDSL